MMRILNEVATELKEEELYALHFTVNDYKCYYIN